MVKPYCILGAGFDVRRAAALGARLPHLLPRNLHREGDMELRQRRSMRAATASLAALMLLLTALVQTVAAAPQGDPRLIGGRPADLGE